MYVCRDCVRTWSTVICWIERQRPRILMIEWWVDIVTAEKCWRSAGENVRACLHVLSPYPFPSNLHCVNGDRPVDGENGFCTQSACEMVRFYWHNVKLWWRRTCTWRRWWYVQTGLNAHSHSTWLETGPGPIECQSIGTGTAQVAVWKQPCNIMKANFVLVPVRWSFVWISRSKAEGR